MNYLDPAFMPMRTFIDQTQKIVFKKKAIVDREECKEVIQKVNNLVQHGEEGRLFAVVHVCGKQFKVTAGDTFIIEGYWPPTIGDQIKFEKVELPSLMKSKQFFKKIFYFVWKVLLVGGDSFSVIGRPMLDTNVFDVKATVVEKAFSNPKPNFILKQRKRYRRMIFHQSAQTMVRINSIDIIQDLTS